MEFKNISYLSLETIVAATKHGDYMAMSLVIQQYKDYIAALATRKLYDEYGDTYFCVDEELRSRLESKLFAKIREFRIMGY